MLNLDGFESLYAALHGVRKALDVARAASYEIGELAVNETKHRGMRVRGKLVILVLGRLVALRDIGDRWARQTRRDWGMCQGGILWRRGSRVELIDRNRGRHCEKRSRDDKIREQVGKREREMTVKTRAVTVRMRVAF